MQLDLGEQVGKGSHLLVFEADAIAVDRGQADPKATTRVEHLCMEATDPVRVPVVDGHSTSISISS